MPGVLTPRELQTLQLLATGYSNPRIAEALVIEVKSVEMIVGHIFRKLHVRELYPGQHPRVTAAMLYRDHWRAMADREEWARVENEIWLKHQE